MKANQDFDRMESFWAYMVKNNLKQRPASVPSPDYLDLQHPYHRNPIVGLDQLIAPLPSGFRSLAFNYRMSVPVITLINHVITKGRYINQLEDCAEGSSHGTFNATSLQETEYTARLLASTDLTLIERSICIGILISILDRTRTERFSALYMQHMQLHAEELCQWQDIFEDTDLADFYLWAAIGIAGNMMPPKTPFLTPKYKEDKRFKLLMVAMQKYGHLSWEDVLDILKKFIAEPRCVESWHNAWKLGLQHLH